MNSETLYFRKFHTIVGYDIFVKMEDVMRVWYDKDKQSVAIMYRNGMVDHLTDDLRKVLLGK